MGKISRRKANTPRRVARQGRELINFHRGHRLKVPSHPTEFMSRPWFPLTVRIDNVGVDVSFLNLRSSILTQLGFGLATNSLNVRFRSIRLWGPIPVGTSPLNMIVYDVFNDSPSGSSTEGVLEQITDYPDAVNRAAVGYEFSTAQQQMSVTLVAGNGQAITSQTGAGPSSVMYINLLWRIFTTTPTTNGDDEYDSEIEVISQVSGRTVKQEKRIERALSKLKL